MKTGHLRGEARLDNGKTVASCSACGLEFTSGAPDLNTARTELKSMFDGHPCLPAQKTREDVNQAAARIIREATKD
jgi:hypothetical protein